MDRDLLPPDGLDQQQGYQAERQENGRYVDDHAAVGNWGAGLGSRCIGDGNPFSANLKLFFLGQIGQGLIENAHELRGILADAKSQINGKTCGTDDI